ncbi:MAG: Hsp70 family protein [Planctomycetaceae bacterium]|nr:Hsp70 family protein [Planctomycetaceae bacterium]
MSNDLKNQVYGIDLGTTYSAIAFINEYGKAEIIKNSDGESVTPSVVYFESPANITVGTNAKSAGNTGPEAAQRVADFVKTQMSNETWKFAVDGKEYGPVEISSLILKRLVEDAKKTGGHEVRDVVITCPAYFGELERLRTRQAGELIGLNVMEILDEPVAAAINYGLEDTNTKGKNVIVYDLGGGTFDVTVISIGADPDKTEIRVVCTEGDHQLGGKNWDDRIVDYYLAEFQNNTGTDIMQGDPQDVHETLYDLRIDAERNKKTLTARNDVGHKINFGGEKASITLTREKFDELTTDLLERTISLTDKVLEQAKSKGIAKIDSFLLVGGSTRMPQVEAKIVEKYSASLGVKPVWFDVDEAVAKGAAKEAEILAIKRAVFGDKSVDSPVQPSHADIQKVALASGKTVDQIKGLLNTTTQKVATKSYGIEALVGAAQEKKVCNLIIKQTIVPVTVRERFEAADNDTYVLPLIIYSNDETIRHTELDMCTKVGEAMFELPQKMDRGMPIDIQFTLTDEGKLRLYALDPTHNQSKEAEFTPEGALTEEQMQEAKKRTGMLQVT